METDVNGEVGGADRFPKQRPLSATLFWICAAVTLASIAGILWLSIAGVPTSDFGVLPRILLVGLAILFAVASLATTEIIPPKGARTWAHIRKPKVLGQIVFLLLSAAAFVVGIGNIFNPPADQATANKVAHDVAAVNATTTDTNQKVSDLEKLLHRLFPDDPAVLNDIGGKWGDIGSDWGPACAVVYDIKIIRRGNHAALLAETVRTPADVKHYRFLGDIIGAAQDTLYVEGVEPEKARGDTAHFTYNAATQRLTWDDRVRGSGGVEIYQRCDGSKGS